MLKHSYKLCVLRFDFPAAFGRLCVETELMTEWLHNGEPAAFGRLCVETRFFSNHQI